MSFQWGGLDTLSSWNPILDTLIWKSWHLKVFEVVSLNLVAQQVLIKWFYWMRNALKVVNPCMCTTDINGLLLHTRPGKLWPLKPSGNNNALCEEGEGLLRILEY